MKDQVYSWRISAQKKAELESEARREGTSLARLLEKITAEWLQEQRSSRSDLATARWTLPMPRWCISPPASP